MRKIPLASRGDPDPIRAGSQGDRLGISIRYRMERSKWRSRHGCVDQRNGTPLNSFDHEGATRGPAGRVGAQEGLISLALPPLMQVPVPVSSALFTLLHDVCAHCSKIEKCYQLPSCRIVDRPPLTAVLDQP